MITPNTKDYLDGILDDNEKVAIGQFIESEVMREAVKKCLLVGIYGNGTLEKGKAADPLRNFAIRLAFKSPTMTNEQIGADLRASIAGINALELAFDTMTKYIPEPERPNKKHNPAR